jgi:hypothetical protein
VATVAVRVTEVPLLINAPHVPVAPLASDEHEVIKPPPDETEPPSVADTSRPYCGNAAMTVIVKFDLTKSDPEEVFGKVAVLGVAAFEVIDEIV